MVCESNDIDACEEGSPSTVPIGIRLDLGSPGTVPIGIPEQDIVMYNLIKKDIANPPFYNLIFHQCIFWSVGAVNYGM